MADVLPATLRVALRSKIALGDFVNFGPLPPEFNATPICIQELTEHHELKHSHEMFFDNVSSRYVTSGTSRWQ